MLTGGWKHVHKGCRWAQAMVRVFEEKPSGQPQATGGQLPWASGTHRAVAGKRPAPPRPPADPEKEYSLLEEARALAAQVCPSPSSIRPSQGLSLQA